MENNVNSDQSSEQSQNQFTFDSATNSIAFPDGNTLSVDEVAKGYMRQQDYTRKTQELSRLREKVKQWTDFSDALEQHPRGKEIGKKILDLWNQETNQGQSPQPNQQTTNDTEVKLERVELYQNRMMYESELGRKLSDEEWILTLNLMANSEEELSVMDAHQRIQKWIHGIQKNTKPNKMAAPAGSTHVTGTITPKKPLSQMTEQEKREVMKAALEPMIRNQ